MRVVRAIVPAGAPAPGLCEITSPYGLRAQPAFDVREVALPRGHLAKAHGDDSAPVLAWIADTLSLNLNFDAATVSAGSGAGP